MTVTFMTGFEVQQITSDTNSGSSTGTASYSTAIKRTGAASLRCNPASGVAGYASVVALNGWDNFGFYVASLPSVARRIRGSGSFPGLWLNSGGTLYVTNTAGTTIGTSSTALSTGTWYWIGVRWDSFTGVCLQINGVDEVSGTQDGTPGSQYGCAGTEASAIDIYFDDIVIDNAGFLAPSKVALLLPISDNGAHTGWQAGAGGATNLWDGVNNTPPAGVASASETDTTNIEAIASTGGTYSANLTTYTTAGVNSGDTVLAVRSIIRHGEDIATGTKTGTVGAATNPTITGIAITFGSDGGAHGAEVGVWSTQLGTLKTSPSVTLGTSPTLDVVRPNEARVGCIDFMGMNVAWTPAAVVAVPYYRPYPQLLAQ